MLGAAVGSIQHLNARRIHRYGLGDENANRTPERERERARGREGERSSVWGCASRKLAGGQSGADLLADIIRIRSERVEAHLCAPHLSCAKLAMHLPTVYEFCIIPELALIW